MKTKVIAHEKSDGTIEPTHEIEIVCAHCKDAVSEKEQETGTCTNCGEPWAASQSVTLSVSTLPAIGGIIINIG